MLNRILSIFRKESRYVDLPDLPEYPEPGTEEETVTIEERMADAPVGSKMWMCGVDATYVYTKQEDGSVEEYVVKKRG